MQATAELSRNHAFVVTAAYVEKCWGLLAARIGPVDAVAHSVDNIQRPFDTAKKLAAYENTRDREIKRLALTARSDDHSKSARVTFGGYVPITASIEGPELVVTRLRDDISDVLAGTKAWYSWIARVNAGYIGMALILVVSLFANLVTPDQEGPFPGVGFAKAALAIGILLLMLGCFAGLAWLFNYVRLRFFPVASFALGQGVDRFDFAERVRWCVLVAFFVSVTASAIILMVWPTAY